jgi:hypothetical protein
MVPGVRELAREHSLGPSLVLIRGRRFPDYASAAAYNPVNLRATQPVYAWDASPEARAGVLAAFAERPVYFVDGPSITRRGYVLRAGPMTGAEALSSGIPVDVAGDDHLVYDPVTARRPVTPPPGTR